MYREGSIRDARRLKIDVEDLSNLNEFIWISSIARCADDLHLVAWYLCLVLDVNGHRCGDGQSADAVKFGERCLRVLCVHVANIGSRRLSRDTFDGV